MPPVRIRSVDQAISIIPHLLGYRPCEDLVILVINPGLVCTVRADLEEVRTPGGLMALLGPVATRFPDSQLLMVAWSEGGRQACDALQLAESMFGPERVIDAVATDGARWWSLYCDSERCAEDGHAVVVDEEVRAEAVYRGLGVLPDRTTLAASVAGPTPEQLAADGPLLIETGQWAAELSHREAADEITRIWTEIAESEDPPDVRTALQLAHLTCDDEIALAQWVSTEADVARAMVRAWTQVIAHVPESMVARPLVLCGLAAWLTGDGALESCCLERASGIDPDLVIFRALDHLQRSAVHPSAWPLMAPDPELIAHGILLDAVAPAGPVHKRPRRSSRGRRTARRRRR
ncbi:MAG: DUF4192 domain-containing protein [Acidipropionibacterium jensenii]|uniref:DUF4192 domain-containing protein n=1 Tax=Acidipropionibacterium jensenii TaxID=1749 RepID=UPI002647AEBF|nr:DUF4192 domain-containing protein [Acidipropionibacterium jensenii]MDN6511995.1 DUF4192 domain-containing protein [Acidipropionibacterium jensenii]